MQARKEGFIVVIFALILSRDKRVTSAIKTIIVPFCRTFIGIFFLFLGHFMKRLLHAFKF